MIAARALWIICLDIELFCGIVRMGTDGAENRGITVGYREQSVEFAHPRRDSHHLTDACRMGAGDQFVTFRVEIGKVEMAMGVDQHGRLSVQAFTSGAT